MKADFIAFPLALFLFLPTLFPSHLISLPSFLTLSSFRLSPHSLYRMPRMFNNFFFNSLLATAAQSQLLTADSAVMSLTAGERLYLFASQNITAVGDASCRKSRLLPSCGFSCDAFCRLWEIISLQQLMLWEPPPTEKTCCCLVLQKCCDYGNRELKARCLGEVHPKNNSVLSKSKNRALETFWEDFGEFCEPQRSFWGTYVAHKPQINHVWCTGFCSKSCSHN